MNIWVSDSTMQALASLPPKSPLKRSLLPADENLYALTLAETAYIANAEQQQQQQHLRGCPGGIDKVRVKKERKGMVRKRMSSLDDQKQVKKKRRRKTNPVK